MIGGENPKIEVIGLIETPFRGPVGTPIQPSRAGGAKGRVRVDPRFAAGLKDIESFERIWLIYWLRQASWAQLLIAPLLDEQKRGIFATRAPLRPTPIGISAVRLLAIRGCVLDVAEVDMVDGTPLLDIKPYVPAFDSYPGSRAGWIQSSPSDHHLADGCFGQEREDI